ncbi:MAG TPA: alpha/beta hydrolase [Candidatus Saccharimonadales bacterium]|nr:alpha/beta hydrolase [Candidatus Saccharimonadales bacterium]
MKEFERIWHRWLRRPYRLHITEDMGQGDPVVLLHGIASSGAAWRPLSVLLVAQKRRVIAPDLLGFGDSPKPQDVDYSVETHARAVLAALRRQRVRGPITLVAHSMGCLVAVHIAARYPRRIKHVILYEPPLLVDMPEFRTHARRRKQYFAFFEYLMKHPELALAQDRALLRMLRKISGFALDEEMWTAFERSLRNTIMGQQAYKDLHAISIPTDIVYGRFDIAVTRADVRNMFRHNKNITLHMTNQQHDITIQASRYLARLLETRKTP